MNEGTTPNPTAERNFTEDQHKRTDSVSETLDAEATAIQTADQVIEDERRGRLLTQENELIKELLAEAGVFADAPTPNKGEVVPAAEFQSLVKRLRDALETRQPSENDREALVRVVANHPIAPLMRLGGDAGYPLADAILAAGFSRAAVPDAALAALERVRAEADAYAEQSDVMEPCGAVAQALRTALDGAPEPETPELFPGTNAALDRLTVRKAAPAEAFCIEHGNFHAVELGDPTCEFEDGLGEPVGGEKP